MATGNLSFKEQETKIVDKIRKVMERIAEWDKQCRNTDRLYCLLEHNLKQYENLRKNAKQKF